MKRTFFFCSAAILLLTATPLQAWESFLDGSSRPQNNGWTRVGDVGTIVDLGGGNSGIQQTDDTTGGYDQWSLVNTNEASTLAARFRVDSYGGGPINILQLTTAHDAQNPSPALAVAIRDSRFYLIRFIADNTGAAVEESRLADLAPVEAGVFNEAYLFIDNSTERVRLFWNNGLRYSGVETNVAYLFAGGTAEAEFGASNFYPEQDRSGLSTITFDWVGLGSVSDLPLALPFIAWSAYLDGSTFPGGEWQPYIVGDSGSTLVIDFIEPANGAANQALEINSGSGINEWFAGPLFDDEVFGGARFRLVDFSPNGKENLLALTTASDPLSPAPSITLVEGRYKLWSYVDPDTEGSPGSEIMDIGPVVAGEWHTVYLHARKNGRVRLWWDGQLLFDGMAPLVNLFDGYFEWGSGSWQYDASDIVNFDWVSYGAFTPPSGLTTVPPNGALFQQPSNGFSFVYLSDDGVETDGFSIFVNGIDRTDDLTITGTVNNREGSLGGLSSNELYRVDLVVIGLDGETNSFTITFDTFSPSSFMFEAEDWNFNGGSFIDNPTPTSAPADNSYFGQVGGQAFDHNELSTDFGAGPHEYREFDLVGTERTGDVLRQKYIDAQASDPAVTDYNITGVEVSEWLNYTRTFPAGNYHIYGRFAYGVPGALFQANVDKVLDATVDNQSLTPLGRFRGGPGREWQAYDFVPLTDAQGNSRIITLDGVETLRVTAVEGGYNANFYILVPAEFPVLQITRSGTDVVISWTATGFRLESAPTVTGAWDPVSNATSPLTNSASEAARFYRLAKPAPPPPDAVVSFEDRADGPLDGVYGGLDWGSGLWSVGGPWAGIESQNVYMNSGSGDPATFRISGGASGAFLLKRLVTTADTDWNISLVDDNGQTLSQNLTGGVPATVTTGWTLPSAWVDITSNVGYNAVFDDITYSR